MIVFITGGAKNGKSSLAQELTLRLSRGGTHYYLATMLPVDAEDHERIRRHVADRAGLGFETVEQPQNILECLTKCDKEAAFLLDSTTALLMNELFVPPDWHLDRSAAERCGNEIVQLAKSVKNIVLVSDYIYSDAERYDEITECYRRALASIDRKITEISDVVLEMVGGNIITHKGVLPQ